MPPSVAITPFFTLEGGDPHGERSADPVIQIGASRIHAGLIGERESALFSWVN